MTVSAGGRGDAEKRMFTAGGCGSRMGGGTMSNEISLVAGEFGEEYEKCMFIPGALAVGNA